MRNSTLVISSNLKRIESLEQFLGTEIGMKVFCKTQDSEALDFVLDPNEQQPDLLVYDIEGNEHCFEVIRVLSYCRPHLPVIVLENQESIDRCAQAIEAGADDFLLMPFHPLQMTICVRNALLCAQLKDAISEHKTRHILSLSSIEAKSSPLIATLFLAKELAKTSSHLLLQGTRGSGLEMFAHAIHAQSDNSREAFEVFNAALFAEEETNRKLFGDEKERGLLEKIGNGTLLIRNIERLTAVTRLRLAGVIRKEVPLRSGTQAKMFCGRVMITENHDMMRSDATKHHAEPFYAQIDALALPIPPLSQMLEDLPYFAEILCHRYAAQEGKSILRMNQDVFDLLLSEAKIHHLDDLANAIFSAVMHCKGSELKAEDFRAYFALNGADILSFIRQQQPATPSVMQDAIPAANEQAANILHCTNPSGNVKRLNEVEEELIRYALERYSGHMSDVAKHLGIGRSTLYRKLSTMGMK